MNLFSAFFYLFSTLTVASASMVVFSRNPVHSTLFLVLSFFNVAGLFVLLGAEFLAMTLILVYVGAVSVLFLFIVMMLDINFVKLNEGFMSYLPIGACVMGVLLIELFIAFGAWKGFPNAYNLLQAPIEEHLSNTEALGRVLYTRYVYHFQSAGLILLIAMIGAIVLTLRHKPGVLRQVVADQIARCPETSVEIRKVKSGQGI
ncbi:MAG: NADH-quinone oxidoreductase subunit J [Alphaproteobacteria bacterium]|nr:NADH-quinone oxidoreductase subunit J [Alphaproteobacteria bacterium]